MLSTRHAPHEFCKYCGAPSWIDPSDQSPPQDYCQESDHGSADDRQMVESDGDLTPMITLRSYWNALQKHPGVPIASACTIMGFVAGLNRPGASIIGALIGAAIMSVFWIPVLSTAMDAAREQAKREEFGDRTA